MVIKKGKKGDTKWSLCTGIDGSGNTNYHVQTEREYEGKKIYWVESFDNLNEAKNWIRCAVN